MKLSLIAVLLTISFIAIAVFGFAASDYDNHNKCIVAIAQGGSLCHNSALDFVVFHLGILKSFSLAIFDFTFLVAVFIALMAALSVWLKIFDGNIDLTALTANNFYLKKSTNALFRASTAEFIKWLSLREKRDPSLSL